MIPKKDKSILDVLYIIILQLITVSCEGSDGKDIDNLLSKRLMAFETKNVELYLSCINPSYKEEKEDQVIELGDIKKRFLINVTPFDNIKITHSDRSISREGNKARVIQKTYVKARIENNGSKFQFLEKINLEKINGKWLIVKESEADFLEGFVFGG